MCMGTPYSKEKQDKIRKAAQKRGYINVYKVAQKASYSFYAPMQDGLYTVGVQKAHNLELENGGWHGFLDLKSAEKWKIKDDVILVCKAKVKWIKNCGSSFWPNSRRLRTVLLTHLCFPKFPKTTVTVREFREQCKKWSNRRKKMKKIGELLRHNLFLMAAAIVCCLLLSWGCIFDSKTVSPSPPPHKVTRNVLDIEIDDYMAKAKLAYDDLDKQDAFKKKILEFGLVVAEGGSLNPVGVIATLAGILGIGAVADNRKKDSLIKMLQNNGGKTG
jgi:hypothetical protein